MLTCLLFEGSKNWNHLISCFKQSQLTSWITALVLSNSYFSLCVIIREFFFIGSILIKNKESKIMENSKVQYKYNILGLFKKVSDNIIIYYRNLDYIKFKI